LNIKHLHVNIRWRKHRDQRNFFT